MNKVFILSLLVFIAACKPENQNPHDAKLPHKVEIKPQILSQKDTGIGLSLMVQVPNNLAEGDYVNLVNRVLKENPTAINVNLVASKSVEDAIEKMESGTSMAKEETDLIGSGHILVYNKLEGNGEIWWIQQKGTVAHKQGEITKL